MKNDNLIEVWNYPNTSSADVGKYKLRQHGIDAEIFGGNVDNYYLTAIGGISLMVRSSDYVQAKKILESKDEVNEEVVKVGDEISGGSIFCSACHSKYIRIKKIQYFDHHLILINILKRWFGYKQVLSCRNCKKVWINR